MRQFLARPVANESLALRVRHFCEELERKGSEEWQVRQADQAVRTYFVNFLKRTDWHSCAQNTVLDASSGRPERA